jgi:carnitine-CoA ligase
MSQASVSSLETEPPVPALIEAWAAVQPDASFCVEVRGRSLTYAQFVNEAHGWSRALTAAGVAPGDIVLTMIPTSCDGLAVWMGIARLRAIDAAVNTDFTGRMLEYMVSDTGARIAIVHSDYIGRFSQAESLADLTQIIVIGEAGSYSEVACRVVSASEFLAGGYKSFELGGHPARHDVSCVIYTSGTTGPSKGVLVPWAQLSATIPPEWQTGAGTAEAQYVPLPMYHIAGRSAVAIMARYGGKLVLRNGFSVHAFWDDIREHRCTITLIAGAMTNFLFRQPPRPDDVDNPLAKIVIAPVIPEHREFAERFGVEIVTGFNMTEISMPVYFPDGIPNWKACGRLRRGYPYYEVRIVDEFDNEVSPGQVGQLIVRTQAPWTLNAGYLGKPEATVTAWQNGWFHTGDAFRVDENGHYFFVDRFKDAIRRRGENISSFELEAVVNDHPAVAESAAIGVPSEFGEDDVQIFVVLRHGMDVEPEQLIEFLSPRMPRFMLPRFVQVLSSLPKTEATQRVRKQEIRNLVDPALRWDREAAARQLQDG